MHIGVIAGGGALPKHVVKAAQTDGHEVTIIALKGFAKALDYEEAKAFGIAEFGKITKALKKAKATHICFAGIVKRPDFKSLKPDLKAMFHMGGAMKAAKQGDDALMRYLLGLFEKEGFEVIAPQDVCQSLLLPEGILGAIALTEQHKNDAQKACEIASAIGALDIGQGAVICDGVVLAVEAQEGTDAMLRRIAELPVEIRGSSIERKGVLAKMIKPTQETRVDLPTIGPATLENAAAAGLAGIVAEGGRAFIIDREEVIALANAAGLFIAGLPASKS
ncbi:LpxI family protein [Hellea balneolensis]|uniref:LpxI family protein n=1 Tax=Hellea balneolensis TaxID=287478 RepID=UPI0004295BBD|nr:UDP-2,3-diacylglucosamine diphosphatase LpxI [Hellea balneolensis]